MSVTPRVAKAHYIFLMARTHPHADANYRVISLPGGSFGVEVSIPDSYPTTVSKFATKADAQTWITKHKTRVEEQNQGDGLYRKRFSRTNQSAGQ